MQGNTISSKTITPMTKPHDYLAITSGSFGVLGAISEGEDFEEKLKECLSQKFTDMSNIIDPSGKKATFTFHARPIVGGTLSGQWVTVKLEPIRLY